MYTMVRRVEAVNFLATGTLDLFNGKSEAFKPKNTVPTVNHGGGRLVFWAVSRPMYPDYLAKINATMEQY